MEFGFLSADNDSDFGLYREGGEGTGGVPDPAPAPARIPKTYTEDEYKALSKMKGDLQAKLTASEAENTTFKTRDMSDAQKLEERAKTAEVERDSHAAGLKQERLERAIEREATSLKIIDPEAALRLLDHTKIEYDGDRAKNVKALLEQLVKDKPYLIAVAGNGGAANPALSRGGNLSLEDQINAEFAKRSRGSRI